MKVLVAAAACVVAACESSPSPATPQILTFERWSPAQASAHDILLAARGDVVVLSKRISRDGGATWEPLETRAGAIAGVAITGQTLTVYGSSVKLARWNLATDTLAAIPSQPAYTSERTWRVDPAGNAIVFDAVENALAFERDGAWTTSKLPQPATTEVRPYIKDVESNGQTVLVVSAWGVHRSIDGTSWTYVGASGNARDLLALGDQRFALVGDGPARLFDAGGVEAGVAPGLVLDANEAIVCEDGAIVDKNRVTQDLGASWRALIRAGDLSMQVQRAGCGGGRYWVLALSDVWGYRFVRYDALDAPGILAGNWDAAGDHAWTSSNAPIVRTADGTFLVGGLALAPDAPEWTLRETPARTWASGDALFGVQRPSFYTSLDGGATWLATDASELGIAEPEAFARAPDGALLVSEFGGGSNEAGDTWRAAVWRSIDQGATWAIAYEGIATRGAGEDTVVGQAHRFVGVTGDGTWIATDAVSRDAGTTWQPTAVKGDRGLAHLTMEGALVTGGADEMLWRVYADGGLGELLATYEIEVDDRPVPASQLRAVAFDSEGYAYVARGNPHVQIWRSDRPLH